MLSDFNHGIEYASALDEKDPLASFRNEFSIPKIKGKDSLYFVGNSLGLRPNRSKQLVDEELDNWARLGVEGHFEGAHPWMPYHEFVMDSMAKIVGANTLEVAPSNTLTTNLHLLMVSFFRPNKNKRKILIEKKAFPSDIYAMKSQLRFHGLDPEKDLIQIGPRKDEDTIRTEDILDTINKNGDDIALILLGGVNYLTGQVFDMKQITEAGHQKGCKVGFDLAHAAGNVPLHLHDWEVDFAVWCSYKYLNSGPGGIGGLFVHENHHHNPNIPRFEGWWGHDKKTRFQMPDTFSPMASAEAWQLSNPAILPLASLRGSLEIFEKAGMMTKLREKSELLTGYLELLLLETCKDSIEILTPSRKAERGCQLSLRVHGKGEDALNALRDHGVICDFRRPNVIRVAPVPLYNKFEDVYNFVQILKEL